MFCLGQTITFGIALWSGQRESTIPATKQRLITIIRTIMDVHEWHRQRKEVLQTPPVSFSTVVGQRTGFPLKLIKVRVVSIKTIATFAGSTKGNGGSTVGEGEHLRIGTAHDRLRAPVGRASTADRLVRDVCLEDVTSSGLPCFWDGWLPQTGGPPNRKTEATLSK